MQAASKQLYETISEVYEPDWTGHDLLTVQSQSVEMLWQDLGHKMTDQVLIPLNTYQGQFPEMRVRAPVGRQTALRLVCRLAKSADFVVHVYRVDSRVDLASQFVKSRLKKASSNLSTCYLAYESIYKST